MRLNPYGGRTAKVRLEGCFSRFAVRFWGIRRTAKLPLEASISPFFSFADRSGGHCGRAKKKNPARGLAGSKGQRIWFEDGSAM